MNGFLSAPCARHAVMNVLLVRQAAIWIPHSSFILSQLIVNSISVLSRNISNVNANTKARSRSHFSLRFEFLTNRVLSRREGRWHNKCGNYSRYIRTINAIVDPNERQAGVFAGTANCCSPRRVIVASSIPPRVVALTRIERRARFFSSPANASTAHSASSRRGHLLVLG